MKTEIVSSRVLYKYHETFLGYINHDFFMLFEEQYNIEKLIYMLELIVTPEFESQIHNLCVPTHFNLPTLLQEMASSVYVNTHTHTH